MSRNTIPSGDPTLPPIYTVRGRRIVLDSGLAALYGVATSQFNRAIKRNAVRFPADFAFRLTTEEWDTLRCQIGILKTGRGHPPVLRPLQSQI